METLECQKLIEIELDSYEFTDKQFKKFVNSCRSMVRGSYEYRVWTDYIKFTLSHSQCQFTGENCEEVTVDIHHHPFSMENIIRCVIDKFFQTYQRVNSFDICKQVVKLHYENKIGYVCLVRTLHEKFHNGFLSIPIELVNGDWKSFEKEFPPKDEDIKQLINTYRRFNLSNTPKLKWDRESYIIYDVLD